MEGDSSKGGFLLLLLGGRFELFFDDLDGGSSVCFEDDLVIVSRLSIFESSLTYPVLDIAGCSKDLPFRRLDFGGRAASCFTASCGGEVSTFWRLLRLVADGGLDSMDGSV